VVNETRRVEFATRTKRVCVCVSVIVCTWYERAVSHACSLARASGSKARAQKVDRDGRLFIVLLDSTPSPSLSRTRSRDSTRAHFADAGRDLAGLSFWQGNGDRQFRAERFAKIWNFTFVSRENVELVEILI